MARGSAAKENITKKILEVFPGAFLYNNGKEIRIPESEGGEILQIKVTLTCAKTNVEGGSDVKIPGSSSVETTSTPAADFMNEPTEEEKKAVSNLCEKLGLI